MQTNKCEKAMNRYLELDKNARVPFSITMHFLFCKNCRKNVRMLSRAEKSIQAPLVIQAPVTDASIQNVLKSIELSGTEIKKNPISLKKWIIAGIVMIAMLFTTILYAGKMSKTVSFTYAMMIAGCTIAYCSAFVFCNLDFFVKKLTVKLSN